MITVYHLENSRSERVIWLLEELGLPYELQRFSREPTMRAPDALKAISPMGKAPMIRDGDTVIVESGAIVEYIANTAGGGRLAVKPGAPNYGAYLQWMHFAEGSAMPAFILNLFVGGFFPGIDPDSPLIGMARQAGAQTLSFIDGELAKTPYFAGAEFTAADIMMAYCFGIVRSPVMNTDMAAYPHLADYITRIEARPAYQKAMAIANPK
ncbi:MAG TPA: glutathione S-transferase family protein [Alphaproteobacteria bacterium]|nr:glutathione S-transferase family protein [Alphaproteobacteria bacterium]